MGEINMKKTRFAFILMVFMLLSAVITTHAAQQDLGEVTSLEDRSLIINSNKGSRESTKVTKINTDLGPIGTIFFPAIVGLMSDIHVDYIKGNGTGYFFPDNGISRAEAAVILYRLLDDMVPVSVSYMDVPTDSWYYDAAVQLGSLGIIRPIETTFQGSEQLTRGEFIRYLSCFFPLRTDVQQFSDVVSQDENAAAILSARAYGWLEGYGDGRVGPNDILKRCQAVALINRALGRSSDHTLVDNAHPALYLDVSPSDWYYYDVMEATVPHEYSDKWSSGETWSSWEPVNTGLPDDFRTNGFHLFDGWSFFYSDSTSDILRNCTEDSFTFDSQGHYTTGNSWLDAQIRGIILSKINMSMTQSDMLRTLYAHVRDDYKYLSWDLFPAGDTTFTEAATTQILSTGRGNCYCYASLFYYLSRWIGFDTKIYSGTAGFSNWLPHCWTEINGLIYDTQLEWRYVHRDNDLSYHWWFYGIQDGKGGWIYRK